MHDQLALLPDPIDVAFLEFHHNHPDIYDDLVEIVTDIKKAGGRRVSLRDAFGAMRLDAALRGVDHEGFALNNSYASRYARLIAANRPELAGMLVTRRLRSAA